MKTLVNFPYQHVLILGLAKSGTAAAHLLLDHGVTVRVNDLNASFSDPEVQALKQKGAECILGHHSLSVIDGIEVMIKNPGIPYEHPLVKAAINRQIPVLTEIELAGQIAEGKIIGITGSNGKTTTTTLITNMLQHSNQSVKMAGNIGIAASDVARQTKQDDVLVLELSSFQLLGVQTFRPDIAVILNLFEAHLDYHHTLENYQTAKSYIFKNQTADDVLVYNAEDPLIVDAVKEAKSQLMPFSTKRVMRDGAWLDDHAIYFKNEKIMDRKEIVLVGEHNLENILAAISAAKLAGATKDGIYRTLTTFSGVKHRLQFVGKIHDRLFYNDSKATNNLATQKALSSFKQPIILIAGGLDRGAEFDELLPYLTHVKAMVVYGETKEKLRALADKANIKAVVVNELSEAVQAAYHLSVPNDVILLSPACASWDQFRTFEERGDMFIDAVHKLA